MSANNGGIKFSEWIQDGFALYKQSIGIWIGASALAVLISLVSFGLLAGPLMAGLSWMALAMADRKTPAPQVGDVFKGFDWFLQSFLFHIVWGILLMAVSFVLNFIFCIGTVLSIAVNVAVSTAIMFGLFLIVDRKLDFWPASLASWEAVKPRLFPMLGLYVVSAVIGLCGLIACGIGVIATLPIMVCILAVAYRDVFGQPAGA